MDIQEQIRHRFSMVSANYFDLWLSKNIATKIDIEQLYLSTQLVVKNDWNN